MQKARAAGFAGCFYRETNPGTRGQMRQRNYSKEIRTTYGIEYGHRNGILLEEVHLVSV